MAYLVLSFRENQFLYKKSHFLSTGERVGYVSGENEKWRLKEDE